MKKIYLLLFLAVSLFITANAQFNGEKATMVVATETGNDAEIAIVDRLTNMGLDVVMVAEAQATDDIASSTDLLLISATVNSGNTITNMPGLADYDIPVINWEPGLYDDQGFCPPDVSGSVVEPEGKIKIVDDQHPIAAELTGTVTIATVTGEFKVTTGKPEGEVEIIAVSTTDDSLAVLFAYEEGAAMFNGTAPARRVGSFLHNEVAASMIEDGWALFESQVVWAMGPYETGINNNNSQNFGISVSPNPSSGNFKLSFVADYSQTVEINIFSVTGQKVLSTFFEANHGMNAFNIDGSELKAGLYYYSLSISNQIAGGKILIVE